MTEQEEFEFRKRLEDENQHSQKPPEQPGILSQIGQGALGAFETGMNKLDSVTGAPVRSAVSKFQDNWKDLPGAVEAYKKQFGEDNSKAPTGRMIAQRAGVPDTALSDVAPSLYSDDPKSWKPSKGGLLDPTASGVAGVGIDMATDPISYIPFEKAVEGAGNLAKKSLPSAAKVAETLTGVPARETETYAKNLDEVNRVAKKYGGDVATAADETRKKFGADIAQAKGVRNATIKDATQALPSQQIDVSSVIQSLEDAKARLNPKFKAGEIKEVEGIIDTVKNAAGDTGKVSTADAYDLKKYLNDMASGAYKKDGQIFQVGKDAAQAAKGGAFEAKTVLHEVEPAIQGADKDLSTLHNIEKRMNKNLIAEGKPESALLAAGSGNQRNRNILQSLGRLTGTDMAGEADKLAAVRRFAKPDLLPVDSTGKSFTRMATGGAMGSLMGPAGGVVGLAATSPAALKTGINAGVKGFRAAEAIAPAAKALYMGGAEGARNQEPISNKETVLARLQTKGSQFYGPLAKAAQRGDNSYASTYYLLSQSYPEFQKALGDEKESESNSEAKTFQQTDK